ncbi:MAG: porin family protein [Candidatus Margulisbacteria bacterium]|jgi:hypothetical protein|nr:porin family protein [Candidatus Margulisiibacteriota bacterium]
MDKGVIAAALILSLCCAEPQLRLGLGPTNYDHADFSFQANTGFTELTFNPAARLQLGLKYTSSGVILNQSQRFDARGLLAVFKIYLNTVSAKTPYFGGNFGWLNTEISSSRSLYTARGAWCAEWLGGYSFRLNELNRLNLEYAHQVIDGGYVPDAKLLSDTWTLSWAVTLEPFSEQPRYHQTPAESIATRQEYLRQKITYNNEQIRKYDALIAKYNQKFLDKSASDAELNERDFLLGQRDQLEADNQKMLELLEK